MATGSSRSPEIGYAVKANDLRQPKAESTATESGGLPEAEAVAPLVEKTETSDGELQSCGERKRRHRRRKYGRLKRVRLEALALPTTDAESESEKQFIVVDGPQVGIFRSPTCSTDAASDGKARSWFRRKLIYQNRKSSSSTRVSSRERCEQYLKQFVAALFSTLGLLCLMVAYTMLGGYVFSRLESSNELNAKADMRQVAV